MNQEEKQEIRKNGISQLELLNLCTSCNGLKKHCPWYMPAVGTKKCKTYLAIENDMRKYAKGEEPLTYNQLPEHIANQW